MGISKAELARRLELKTDRTVHMWLSGQRVPSRPTQARIAQLREQMRAAKSRKGAAPPGDLGRRLERVEAAVSSGFARVEELLHLVLRRLPEMGVVEHATEVHGADKQQARQKNR